MGIYAIRLPDVGEGIAEAELTEWHVKPGDIVKEDDVLAAVMTDKAAVEVPSSVEGKVVELGGEIGDMLAIGSVLVRIEVDGDGNEDASAPEASKPTPAPKEDKPEPKPEPQAKTTEPARPLVKTSKPVARAKNTKPLAAPSVRARAREEGVDLRQVPGSGPGGRISHADLENWIASGGIQQGSVTRGKNTGVEEVRVVGMRRKIAEKMAISKRQIPHITIVEEIEMDALEDLRAALNRKYKDQRPKLTLLPFLMRAIVEAVREQPELNARYDDDEGIIYRHGGVHVGIATQTPNGLNVPVVHHAESGSLWDNASELTRLAEAARDGSIKRDELMGGTITITSLGALGAIATTPIINHPEVAIVGVNKLQMRPVWDGQQFQPCKMMNISCSFDHRVIDGWDAAVFVQKLKLLLETPAMLFVEGQMTDIKCKVLVIGAGPGGYVCAIRAGQLGLDAVVVDEARAGGTCLNIGCIPSKAMIHATDEFYKMTHAAAGPLGISASAPTIDLKQTVAWKDGIVERLTGGVGGLLRKAGVKMVSGRARFVDGKTVVVKGEDGDTQIRADYIVIATGSAPVELPFLPFGGAVLSSTEALSLTEVPKSLAVVGGGYIGLELGTVFAKLGSKVTIVEAEDRILPLYDKALTRPVHKRLEELGVTVMTGTKAQSHEASVLTTDVGDVEAERVLVTVGRRARTQGIGIDELSLTMNGPFIRIDKMCQTSMRGIYAIGDVTGEPMLAHRAMAQGEMVAEYLAGHSVEWDKRAIPAVCFTDPEIVTCGALPGEIDGTKSAEFPFIANGRAMTTERDDGFIRVVWREADNAVIGLQGVGAGISELSAAFSLAIEMGACLEDIAATVHAHPTQSEGLQEACLKALGHALHI